MPRQFRLFSLTLCTCVLLLLCACAESTQSSVSTEDTENETSAYPVWDASTIYRAGDIVEHKGQYFRVLWWTRGEEPTVDGVRDAWQYLGEAPRSNQPYFDDLPADAWYTETITTLAASQIYTSTGIIGSFQPNHPLTRGQFAVWLCRAMDITPIDAQENYPDAGDTWYTRYLAALRQKGWRFDGGSDYFRPEHHITRQEMCALVYFLCNGFSEDPDTTFAAYTDADEVADWAIQPMSWCIDRGIIHCPTHLLAPTRTATRAEGSQIIYNLIYES